LLASSAREKSVRLFKCFIDLTKAYDKVNRDILWRILTNIGVPDGLVWLIKGLLVGSRAEIRIKGTIVHGFDLDMGLKQGSVFSPLLFNIFFGCIIKAWQVKLEGKGLPLLFNLKGDFLSLHCLNVRAQTESVFITDLLFADDAEIVATSPEDLQVMLDEFVNITKAFGQEVSVKKTKVMVVQKRGEKKSDWPVNHFFVDGKVLENVDVFTYVGGNENNSADMSNEVSQRLQRMSAGFNAFSDRVFMNPDIHLVTKLRFFVIGVLSGGLYGCATWNYTDKQMARFESWQFRHLKKIMGNKWEDHVSYVDTLARIRGYGIEIYPMVINIGIRRIRYLGHVLRMKDFRLPKMMLFGEVNMGRRVSGGQETSYFKCLKKELKAFHMDKGFVGLNRLAQDRCVWKNLVDEGAGKFWEDWSLNRNDESYRRHVALIKKSWTGDVLPTDEFLLDGWNVKKRGEFYKIEQRENEKVTVREGSKTAIHLLHKIHKQKYKVIHPDVSRVSRELAALRK
jgi:hypothetical protein